MSAVTGHLIIESIPDDSTRVKILSFLSRLSKGAAPDAPARLLTVLPASFKLSLPPEQGALLAAQLVKMGAMARFVTVEQNRQNDQQRISGSPSLKAVLPTGNARDVQRSLTWSGSSNQSVQPARGGGFKSILTILMVVLGSCVLIAAVLGGYRMAGYVDQAADKVLKNTKRRTASNVRAAVKTPEDGYYGRAREHIEANGVKYSLIDDYAKWAVALYSKRDYGSVEHHVSNLVKEKDDPDRMYELYTLYWALGGEAETPEVMGEVLNEWCSRSPDSHIPWLVRGIFNIKRAWHFRGDGWARDVPDEAWDLYHDFLMAADDDLEHAWKLNPSDPNSATFLILVARGLSHPRNEMELQFQNALSASPAHYGAHRQKLEYLKPQWHGSEKEILEFAEQSMKSSDKNPYLGFVFIEANVAPLDGKKDGWKLLGSEVWPRIKREYETLLRRCPNEIRVRYHYAYNAYRAKEMDIAYDQFEAIGDRWMFDIKWSSLESYNKCRAFTHYKKGELLWKKKEYKAALPYLQSSLKYHQTVEALRGTAVCCWFIGSAGKDAVMVKDAEAALLQAKALKPDDKHLHAQLEQVRQWLKSNDK